MSGIRLRTLLVAGCLTLNAAGCRNGWFAPPFPAEGRRWGRFDSQTAAVPRGPEVSADLNRPAALPASPSTLQPESSSHPDREAPSAGSASAAQPDFDSLAAQRAAVRAFKQLGGRISEDSLGTVIAVDLAQTAVTDNDLRLLSSFPTLVELNLRETLITDQGLEAVAALEHLEFLGLTGTLVTDAGLPQLKSLRRLRFLTLGHTSVSDDGLDAIAECTTLEGLNLNGTSVTAAGLVRLQSRLPKCRIVSELTPASTVPTSPTALPPPPALPDASEAPAPPMPPVEEPSPRARMATPFEVDPNPPAEVEPIDPPQTIAPPQAVAPQPAPQPVAAIRSLLPAPETVGTPPGTVGTPYRQPHLQRVLEDSLAEPQVLRAIAQSYSARGDWEAAASVLRTALKRAPDDRPLHFELAVAEARSGDYVSALLHFEHADDLAVAHYNLGVLLHEAGLTEASVLAFRSALRHDPTLAQARAWLAHVESARGTAHAGGTSRAPARQPVLTPVEAQRQSPPQPSNSGALFDEVRIVPHQMTPPTADGT